MAPLNKLAQSQPTWPRMRGFVDVVQQVWSMPGRLWRAAVGAFCVLVFCALFSVGATAQLEVKPQRKNRRQLLRGLHPRHPFLPRLRVGSNHWWRALQTCSAIQRRRAGSRVWSVSPLPLIAMAEL